MSYILKGLIFRLAVLFAIFISYPLQAASDFPCVKEVCVGDGLDKLRAIDWHPVHYTQKRVERIRKDERARRAKTYRGFSRDGVPSYLIVRVFDNDLLDDMAGVKIACSPNALVGSFSSEGGHKTDVHVSLLPSNDADNMVWRVTSINRVYKGLESPSQRKQLHQELNARYGKHLNPKPGESGVLIVPMGKETTLSLHWVDVARNKNYGKHPQCEQSQNISID
ncbi:MAG: hypothetical protein CVU29_06560 [Betaproteobacteria bacterium HGW-Betaproteobacteria-22]|nr:MAG: hypothetical protein CVU29_06560 [Betaproteobacteria bacterium HGW-Betaproteobacteria-22]